MFLQCFVCVSELIIYHYKVNLIFGLKSETKKRYIRSLLEIQSQATAKINLQQIIQGENNNKMKDLEDLKSASDEGLYTGPGEPTGVEESGTYHSEYCVQCRMMSNP